MLPAVSWTSTSLRCRTMLVLHDGLANQKEDAPVMQAPYEPGASARLLVCTAPHSSFYHKGSVFHRRLHYYELYAGVVCQKGLFCTFANIGYPDHVCEAIVIDNPVSSFAICICFRVTIDFVFSGIPGACPRGLSLLPKTS